MADTWLLWLFEREHQFGGPERAKLWIDDVGQIVLSVYDDHDEWNDVVLPPQSASDLSRKLFEAAVERGAMPWLPPRAPEQADRG